MEKCLYKEKNEEAEKEISEMKKVFESEKFEESYIRKLIGGQKGELSVESNYYKGNIAEGNWSLIENDSTIKKMDENKEEYRTVDAMDVLLGLDKYQREKDAEYEYVFIPSYYAINILIFYYLENMENAKKIYGLKNAVVTRKNEKFFGGLPFILKYIGGDYKDRRIDLDKIIDKVSDLQDKLSNNNSSDEFINDIIDCINNFIRKI